MSTFQELMASIGIGAASAILRVAGEVQYRGSTTDVELILRGGDVTQHIEKLSVSLVRFWSTGKSRQTETLATQILAVQFDIAPHQREAFTARFAIPDNAPIGDYSKGLEIAADADILMAINPRDRVVLNIAPHREFFAIAQAMEHLGFLLKGTLNRSITHSDTIIAKFTPTPELDQQIDGITLHLDIAGSTITGQMRLHYVEKSVTDLLKAVVGMNAQDVPIFFERKELLTVDGKLRPDGAIPILRKALADSLILPNNEAHWMLRASQAPSEHGDELLRPAMDTGSTRPAELLRPVGDNARKE